MNLLLATRIYGMIIFFICLKHFVVSNNEHLGTLAIRHLWHESSISKFRHLKICCDTSTHNIFDWLIFLTILSSLSIAAVCDTKNQIILSSHLSLLVKKNQFTTLIFEVNHFNSFFKQIFNNFSIFQRLHGSPTWKPHEKFTRS